MSDTEHNPFGNLLIELGTEELPPKALPQLSEAFRASIEQQLGELKLAFTSVVSYATPRRLAVFVEQVATAQQDQVVEKRGPSVDVAFDAEGEPTKAALGWARGNGISIEQAERHVTDKGEWLLHRATEQGMALSALLPDIVAQAVKQIPVPKPMRWGNHSHSFIRPVHQLTVLLDDTVVPMELFGIRSDRLVTGHRFHHPDLISIASAASYVEQLEQAYVIADFNTRQALIREQIEELAESCGANPVMDESLLAEVTALVEYPVAHMASFDNQFLQVPKEALIYTMKDDQRYFPLESTAGELLNQFIFISNIDSTRPASVIEGNQKVIRPRLADAQFFFDTDKKQRLESRLTKLDTVLFQKQLGSIGDKAKRISQVAERIAGLLACDQGQAARAGLLAKADLVTDMVMEFPEVQGVMGMHYARHDGEDEAVAVAIEAHYHPRFAGDSLPANLVGSCVALADKLDTLVGIFGIGQTPKGDRDPFALRRAAIGMLRILVEQQLPLDLTELVALSAQAYKDKITVDDKVQSDIVDFLLGRFRAWYQDQQIPTDAVQAVLTRRPTVATDFDQRVKAVVNFRTRPEAEALAAANKRVANILSKHQGDIPAIDSKLLAEAEERDLHEAISAIVSDFNNDSSVREGQSKNIDYNAVLERLAALREPIDSFFDNVMVNSEDQAIKLNRLALLRDLQQEFLNVADISLLQPSNA